VELSLYLPFSQKTRKLLLATMSLTKGTSEKGKNQFVVVLVEGCVAEDKSSPLCSNGQRGYALGYAKSYFYICV
jgi:hypothetical protein